MAIPQTLWFTHGATQPVVFVRTWHASSVSSDEQLLGLIAEEAWVQALNLLAALRLKVLGMQP